MAGKQGEFKRQQKASNQQKTLEWLANDDCTHNISELQRYLGCKKWETAQKHYKWALAQVGNELY